MINYPEFQQRGWHVLTPDLRGHGRSAGVTTHVAAFQDYITDLETVRAHFQLDPRLTATLGHSMGALITARFAETQPGKIAAMVMMSPLLRVKIPIPRTTRAFGKVLSWIVPKFRFRSRIAPEDVTRDEVARSNRRSDPLYHNTVTAGWYFEMKQALVRVWRETSVLQLPLLIVQAGEDRIVDPHAAQEWLSTVPSSHKQLIVLQDNYHELFNEPDWQETLCKVAEWLAGLFARDNRHSPQEPSCR